MNQTISFYEQELRAIKSSIIFKIWQSYNLIKNLLLRKPQKESIGRLKMKEQVNIKGLNQHQKNLIKQYNQITNSKFFLVYQIYNHLISYFTPKKFKDGSIGIKIITPPITQVKEIRDLVSIIIPTRNGGSDFHRNLEAIMDQKNIPNREILILDNNSTDGTKEHAIKHGCIVYDIPEDEFGHGKTRAFGALEARGKYLIFSVQDAKPDNENTYATLVNFVKNNGLFAASGSQTPKKDADSFARWQNYYHYQTIYQNQKSIIYDATKVNRSAYFNSDFLSKRKFNCLDDVLACYDKNVFEFTNFTYLDFAEDIKMAEDVILSGKKIGMTSTALVHHSHNVEPVYAFKRSFVDTITLKTIFNQSFGHNKYSNTSIRNKISTLFILSSALLEKSDIKSFDEIKDVAIKIKPKNNNLFLKALVQINSIQDNNKEILDDTIVSSLSRNIPPLLKNYSDYCKKNKLKLHTDKFFANILGSYLAEVVLDSNNMFLKTKIENALNQRV